MNVFRFETHDDTILDVSTIFACSTWMCCERGEGEEEIENQGWSRVKVSSQGTDLKGQWSLRMRANEANQIKAVKQEIVQQEVQDVRKELLLTSPFSSFRHFHKSRSPSLLGRRRSAATLSSVAPRISSISESARYFMSEFMNLEISFLKRSLLCGLWDFGLLRLGRIAPCNFLEILFFAEIFHD